MKQPIIDAFKKSDGFLPEIHKAAIKVAFENNNKFKKFQTPENWFIQVAKIGDLDWPQSHKTMETYELGSKPSKKHRTPEKILRRIGHHPYRAKQPNGWSDLSPDWMSPELLIRRLVYADRSYKFSKPENDNKEFMRGLLQRILINQIKY